MNKGQVNQLQVPPRKDSHYRIALPPKVSDEDVAFQDEQDVLEMTSSTFAVPARWID